MSVPRVGHVARGKPSDCVRGISVKTALLAEDVGKSESKLRFLMICLSNPGVS